MGHEGFKLVDNVLEISVDLDLDAEDGFKEAAEKLSAVEADKLYLDLSRVGFVGSSFFGQMFVLNYKIKKSNRILVLRTPRRLMSIMELLGLPQLVEIEVVDDAAVADAGETTGSSGDNGDS